MTRLPPTAKPPTLRQSIAEWIVLIIAYILASPILLYFWIKDHLCHKSGSTNTPTH